MQFVLAQLQLCARTVVSMVAMVRHSRPCTTSHRYPWTSCQNSKTANGLLKDELGFQGYVVSDWLATHSGVASIEAGLDMNMPGGINFLSPTPSFFGGNVTSSINNESFSVERVDDMVPRIMTPYFHLNQDIDFPPVDGYTPRLGFYGLPSYPYGFNLGPIVDVRQEQHAQLIRDLSAAGTVLLKNTNRALPLDTPENIGVFGNDAADFTKGQYSLIVSSTGLADGDYNVGTLAVSGGSSTGRFPYVVSPLRSLCPCTCATRGLHRLPEVLGKRRRGPLNTDRRVGHHCCRQPDCCRLQ